MSTLSLRIIASICMFIDHLGYCLRIDWMRYVGRLAFPIYVFLMVNGFYHTKNRLRYALRLGLFAVLSQVPFALLCVRQINMPNMNVMVTLLMGLLVIWLGESMRQHKYLRYICLLPALLVYCACYLEWIHSDYDGKGVLLATVFWYFRGKKPWIILGAFLAVWNRELIGLVIELFRGSPLTVPTHWARVQTLSLFSLPLIFRYNGEIGHVPQSPILKKFVQLSFYSFYPVHMLALWFFFIR